VAAKKISLIKLKIDLEGLKDFKGLTKQLTDLNKQLTPTKQNLKSLAQSIREVSKVQPKTISQFKQKDKVLKRLREEVNVNGRAFKRLGIAIEANRKKLQSFNATGKKSANINRQIAFGFASSIAAQALPGFTSQGALIGAQFGKKGAIKGAAIGAALDFTQFVKGATQYSAQVGRLRVALAGVTKDSRKYNQALTIIRSVSDELNVPILEATKQFTQLSASVLGSGGTLKDAEIVFRGVSEAVKATGGDSEDLTSAIRAMSQIFGKGKVSAEELQGQLGERLPGAVVKFAKANNMAMTQLQKDLRDGVVGLDKIIKFSEKLSEDHRKAALDMAASTEESGQRMVNAFKDMKYEIGIIFQDLGGEFNDLITGFLRQINRLLRMINRINNESNARVIAKKKTREKFGAANEATENPLQNLPFIGGLFQSDANKKVEADALDFYNKEFNKAMNSEILADNTRGKFETFANPEAKAKAAQKYKLELGLINQIEFDNLQIERESLIAFEALGGKANEFGLSLDDIKTKLKEARNDTFDFKEEFRKVAQASLNLQDNLEELAVTSINKLADGFAELAVSGKASFGDLARSILADLQRMIVKALFFKTLFGLFPGLETFLGFEKGGVVEKSAKGNVFARNNVQPFYRGGVVDKPSIFPMSTGVGLMAERGPEAIMPLKRGRDGKLGVQASGGIGNIVVNVDASGSSVEGSEQEGRELGRLISVAIQSELINQKRPGGLLA
tara:strand:- start:144 stop:2345 length:2202 start_codon:yes stop_codon:yes gene_type:complete